MRALRQEIIDNRQAGGLRSLMMQFTFSISSVITLVVSFAMSVSLFTKHSPKPLTGLLAFADSRLSSLLMLLLTALLAALLIRFTMENRKQQFSRRRELSLSQKLFRYFLDDYLDDSKAGKDVRIFHQRGLIRHASDQAFLQYKEQQKTLQQEDFRMMRRVDAVETGLSGFVYALVALKALAGAFGVGSLVKYVGLISELIYAILHLSYNVEGVRSNNRYLERLFLYLDQESSLHSGTREPEQGASHTMEFRNVSFRYPGSEDYALRELNITLHAGERLAVVGRNGSGKTTMIKLLCRLYDPDEGSILLDGIDIRDYSYEAYQALFSVVFQDFKLFSFSLGQNVAAQRDYDTAKAERCLTLAGLGERLKNLPQGLETPIYKDFEENGVEISGGEAQKIAIARALYKDAPFMILDEPTAALDPLAEYEIYSKFNEIVGEKSAVFISHRLSSCRFCHKIAVFREGRLVQHGTHENLLAEQGSHYAELWNAQAQYYTNIQRKRS